VLDTVLDLPPHKRDPYLDQVRPPSTVRRYIESLVLSYQRAGDFLEEPAGAPCIQSADTGPLCSWRGRRVGPYQIIDEIDQGGMGAVYRARRADDHFQKLVAIKVLRGGYDTSFRMARFKTERQILAHLEHPNIARLLDGGSTEDAQPYFVMEYIRGRRLDQYCDDCKLNVSERLRLFLTVCSAVQYAHQNLVIHRDIKPGNILVTDDGNPKLLDFGIAKLLDADSDASLAVRSRTIMHMLTPEYASPEQLRAERITTASDVYSLGVVLYELLTGRRPRRQLNREAQGVAVIVTRTEPEKPSMVVSEDYSESDAPDRARIIPKIVSATREASREKLRRRLSGDLDNIILMALREEPGRRYASVEQFSGDIRRHLDGLPVMARPDTLAYRSAKFIRRHRVGVVAGMLLVVSVIVGGATTLREARIARVQRERAERRFNDGRKLANSLIFDIHDSIRNLPGSTVARKLLVDRALLYLDNLSQEATDRPDLERELAAAYERVGDVQGNPRYANLGDTAGANASYRKALGIRLSLAGDHRGSFEDRVALTQTYVKLSFGLGTTNDFVQAFEVLKRAYPIAEKLPADEKDNVQGKEAFAAICFAMGECLADMGNLSSALNYYRKSASIQEAIAGVPPAFRTEVQTNLAGVYDYMSEAVYLQGNLDAALSLLYKAHDIMAQLVSSDPENATLRQFLLQEEYGIGFYLSEKGFPKQALAHYRLALAGYQTLTFADPHDVVVMRYLSKCYMGIGRALAADGEPSRGIEAVRRAVRNLEVLSKADQADTYYKAPEFAYARSALGETYARLAAQPGLSVATKIASLREARSWYQRSLDTWLHLEEKAPLARWDAMQPQKIAGEIAKCDASLAKLNSHN
jgi:serine/threonine protein kinase/tetratricopeptide (TPR) repeat protein